MATRPSEELNVTNPSATDTNIPTRANRSKLSTGDSALDTIIGGGIPRDSLTIVSGPPGAGKTILAQQIAFETARNGMSVIYFTNVSEPHAKLVEHIRNFDFYTPDFIGDQIRIYNVTSQIRTKGLKECLDFIVDTVRHERAQLLVIDSFRGLKHVLDVSVRERGTIFDLAAQLSILGCTSLLIGEYTPEENLTDPEFAVADGTIQLRHLIDGVQAHRSLRVTKLRGVNYLGGEHSFLLSQAGFRAYPRQESLTQAPAYRATNEHISMGIPKLDAMMFGGPIRSSSTLVVGSAGVGKTLIGLHFLAAGAAQDERGLMVSFQENPEQLALRAANFGLAEQIKLDESHIEVLFLSPVELNLDIAAAHIRAAVETRNVRRIVIDSVAELELAGQHPQRFDDFLASMIGFLRQHEVTTLMTRELPQLFGVDLSITTQGLSYIVDNIVLLRYVELDGQLQRAITVLKNRGSDHDKTLRPFVLSQGKVQIGEPFSGLSGIVTGVPRSVGGVNATRYSPAEESQL